MEGKGNDWCIGCVLEYHRVLWWIKVSDLWLGHGKGLGKTIIVVRA